MFAVALAIVGFLIGIFLLYVLTIYTVGEIGGEVAILHRSNPDGSISRRRIWIVDSDGFSWIEHGGRNAWWVAELSKDPTVLVERKGEIITYRGTSDADVQQRYHEMIREKYGWASVVTNFLMRGGADNCPHTPVRLAQVEQ